MAGVAMSTQEQLVRAGERLFARHGLDGVSLRQIGIAAGNSNNSAVQYHFGSKDQLVRAIFEYRLPQLSARRTLLVAERRPDDLRGWVECQVRALLEQSELDDSYYLSFVSALRRYGHTGLFEQMPEPTATERRNYLDQLNTLLTHIPEPLRSNRNSHAMRLIVDTAADRELARATGKPKLPYAMEVADLLDGVVGLLEAPVSAAALAALDGEVTAPPILNSFL